MPDLLFEQPAKMLRLLEPQIVSDLAHRFIQIEDPFPGDIDDLLLDILLRRSAGLFLDQIAGGAALHLSAEDLREIEQAAAGIAVHGARYPEQLQKKVGR